MNFPLNRIFSSHLFNINPDYTDISDVIIGKLAYPAPVMTHDAQSHC
jgi:hypothetical protein